MALEVQRYCVGEASIDRLSMCFASVVELYFLFRVIWSLGSCWMKLRMSLTTGAIVWEPDISSAPWSIR